MPRAIVVGAGIYGLSIAAGFRRRKWDVTLLEQGDVPFEKGSSVDDHRLIRIPYGAEEGYTRMVLAALHAWSGVWQELGVQHYARRGILTLAESRDSSRACWARDSRRVLEKLNVPCEWVEGAAITKRWPVIIGQDNLSALFTSDGGVLFARRIVADWAAHLLARGTDLRTHTRVKSINIEDRSVNLANGERLTADALVIAAGPWIVELMPELAPRLTPSRQVVAYLDPPDQLKALWENSPAIIDVDRADGFYVVPPGAGLKMKIADHAFSKIGDPNERAISSEEVRQIVAACGARLRDFNRYQLLEGRVCFYTVTADEKFIAEPLSKSGQFPSWVVSACSGHGFKFAPLLGDRLVEVIIKAEDPARFMRWVAGDSHV